MTLQRIIREGFVSGLIGAGAIALWFLLVDLVAGHPFYTPAVLGSAVLLHMTNPAAVQVAFSTVVMYTMVHVLAFLVVGFVAAAIVAGVERVPATLYVVAAFFACFEFGFVVVVWVIATPLLGALAWWNVAIGNLIASVGMGLYLWQAHPILRERLAKEPLSGPIVYTHASHADHSGRLS